MSKDTYTPLAAVPNMDRELGELVQEELNTLMEYSFKYGRDEIPTSEDPPLLVARRACSAIMKLHEADRRVTLIECLKYVLNNHATDYENIKEKHKDLTEFELAMMIYGMNLNIWLNFNQDIIDQLKSLEEPKPNLF